MTAMAVAKGAGSVFGAIQSARGKSKLKEADRMGPGVSDPNRLAALEDAKRKTKQLESGTDTTTQEAVKSANQSTSATQRQLGTVTGGAVGGTVSAMLQAMKMGGNIKNQAFAKAGDRGLQMGAVSNQIGKEISQRKLDIEQYRSVQRRAEGADAVKTGSGNFKAGLLGLLPTGEGAEGGSGGAGGLSALLEKYNSSQTEGGVQTSTPGVLPGSGTPLSLDGTTFTGGPSVLPEGF